METEDHDQARAEYRWLLNLSPEAPKQELWSEARRRVVAQVESESAVDQESFTAQVESDSEAAVVVPRRSRRAVAGLVLMCVATPTVVASLYLPTRIGWDDGFFWMWLVGSILGSAAMALLAVADAQIKQSNGMMRGAGLAAIGFVFSVPGILASALMFLLLGLMSSGM